MAAPIARRRLSLVRRAALETHDSEAGPSDAALVARALRGDVTSKERLYRKHVHYVAGMCTRLLRSAEASEDVVQDSFIVAFSKMDSLRDANAFRGWLASIAVSLVRRRLAKQKLLRLLGLDRGLDEAPLDALARDDLSVEARSDLAALDAVLQTLPGKKRIAWMLRYVEGEQIDDVAEACSCSRATVKRWIAEADARVRGVVDLLAEEDPS